MMKINILRAILVIMLAYTFFTIFGFSNQDGKESSSLSRNITIAITNNIKEIQNLNNDEKEIVLSRIESIIRKIAHFSIYALVGFLLMALFSTYKIQEKPRIIISFIIGFIYAISDEVHQIFIQDRSAQITDVMIDSLGVLLGIFVLMLFLEIVNKFIKHTNKI